MKDEKDFQVGLLLIATNKYKQFIEQFLRSVNEYFFFGRQINVYLFIDDTEYEFIIPTRINVRKIKIESLKFPYATLYRYHLFAQIKKHIDSKYVFYSDIDIRFVDFVGEEILPIDFQKENQLVAVRHCGFYAKGGGSWETRKESTAYIPIEKRKFYYAGGFQGGQKDAYLSACETMKNNIEIDRKNNVIATWHDESIFNQYLSERLGSFKELTPDYCMVEQIELRERWGVSGLKPKLIALKKNHEEIRS